MKNSARALSQRFSTAWQRLSLRWKFTLALALVALFPAVIITEALIQVSNHNFDRQLEQQLRSSLQDLQWEIDNLAYESRIQALLIANGMYVQHVGQPLTRMMNPSTIRDLLEEVDPTERPMNLMLVSDASGQVLAQQTMVLAKTGEALLDLTPETHSYYRLSSHQASSIAHLPMFQVARDRQQMISGLVLLSREQLQELGLAQQAKITLRPQPIATLPAKQRPAPVGTYPIADGNIGLLAFAAKPLYENNQFQGLILTGILLNNMPDLVDATTEWSTVDTVATIFAQDLRIATNVPYTDGQTRALGTRVAREVATQVLNQGKTFFGTTDILGSPYVTIYSPLQDFRQQLDLPHPPPIGIAFVGKSQAWIHTMTTQKRLVAFAITLGALLLASVWAYLTANAIVKPIQSLATSTRRVQAGDLTTLVQVHSLDEVGELANAFNAMMRQLRISFEELAQKNHSLEQIRDELLEANEQFEAVLNAVPGTISWINAEGIYKGVNRKLAETLNLPPEAFIGRPLGFLREDRELAAFMQEFVDSPDQFASRVISVKRNGQTAFYLVALQKYMQGTHTVAVGIDISDRIRAEEALRIAEENYRSIFENALEGIFQASTENRFIRVNAAMARIFGFDSPEEMVQSVTSIRDQIYVEASTRDEILNHFATGGTTGHFEFKAYRRDRQIIWVELDMRAVWDAEGKVLYYEGLVQDITERKQREQAMQQQIEELRVEIDHEKRRQQVAEITETEYFQQLRREANYLRQRRQR
ncbi:PAS domain S-box protein [Thermosynechococcus sp. PP45]|uniref:cache domain-containing protein n=1 Tax=unclassified Thermosynechococcus TaxID=2622553 RepID=UPI0026738312|nr:MULTISPECIES: cache domain-containing protein [unclassified Thermosynechococcus]MDR5639927.1 PAS domain S-box protein [Thermosynechococcus sp. PP42]WKT80793.1 PAS domain S-box protein [Thermosynechococcus sp. PP45]WNC24405.1 PAS domain S-box protein [Thermosynechococcus sp. PP551]WNC26983.1 PAS domain S-box protein [Thermosynechococcus sp. PP555]